MLLDLSDKNCLRNLQFKKEISLGESSYQTIMRAMTTGDYSFKNRYAKVNREKHISTGDIYRMDQRRSREKYVLG